MKYCTACGSKNADEARFCTSCGNRFLIGRLRVKRLPHRAMLSLIFSRITLARKKVN